MKKKDRFVKWLSLIPLFALIFFILFFPYKRVISFTHQDTGRLLAYVTIYQQNSFQLKYTHSIHLSEVIENYSINKGEIILNEMIYEDFAIGMPSNAGGNEIFLEKGGKYILSNMNRTFSNIDLRIGQVRANHTLIYNNNVYQLANYLEPGSWVRISVDKLNLWQQLKGVSINGKR